MEDFHVLRLNETNSKRIDMDSFWNSLGRMSLYQYFQIVIVFLALVPLAIPVLSGVFAGPHVTFRCDIENTSVTLRPNASWDVSECRVKMVDNITQEVLLEEACTSYTYQGGGTVMSYIAEWDLVCDDEAVGQLPQTLTMAGMGTGALALPHLGDRYGRRTLGMAALLLQLVVGVGLAFVQNFPLFVFLKFMTGLCQQGVMIPMAVLLVELLPTRLRSLSIFYATGAWVVSMYITGIVGYALRDYGWRSKQLAFGLVALTFFIAIWFLDESIPWLLANSRLRRAETNMNKACRMARKDYEKVLSSLLTEKEATPSLDKEEQELMSPLNEKHEAQCDDIVTTSSSPTSGGVMDLLKNSHMRKIMFIMCYIWMIVSLSYYGLILMSTSLAGDAYVNYFLATSQELPALAIMVFSIQRFGRQRSVLTFHVLSGSALSAAVLVANLAPSTTVFTGLQTGLTLFGLLFVGASFNACWIFTPELYPTNQRNVGVGIASSCARVGAMFSPFFAMLARKVPWAPGALIASGCFLGAFLLTMVPETRWRELPKTVEDVEAWVHEDKIKIKK